MWSLLLQIMEDGVLSPMPTGRADFRNTILVMTSNVGGERLAAGTAGLCRRGRHGAGLEAALQRELRQVFQPEFLNRLDETVLFHPLGDRELEAIAGKLLAAFGQRLAGAGWPSPRPRRRSPSWPARAGRPVRRPAFAAAHPHEVENPAAGDAPAAGNLPGGTLALEAQGRPLALVPGEGSGPFARNKEKPETVSVSRFFWWRQQNSNL